MSECGRWAAVDVTGPDVAYAMSYTLPRGGYALYVQACDHARAYSLYPLGAEVISLPMRGANTCTHPWLGMFACSSAA